MKRGSAVSTDTDHRWVEIEWVILPSEERSENLPADTRELPYVGRARGLVEGVVEVGQSTSVVTLADRVLHGMVVDSAPGYTHSFGRPLAAWIEMRDTIHRLVREPAP